MDSIANFLTQIRNAKMSFKEEVVVSFSKIKFEIVKILKKEGFIENFSKKKREGKTVIEIILKYNPENQKPIISELKRISKQGRRVYVSVKDIKPVKEGRGISIISTSKGIMTGKEAKKNNLGGEFICEVS